MNESVDPMDASVVSVALVSAEKMKIFLYQNTNCPSEVHDVVQQAKNCLELLQAYLQDSEDQTDGSSLRRNQEDCILIAQEIQDVLDDFMFELFRYLLKSNNIPQQSILILPLQSILVLPLKIGQSIKKLKIGQSIQKLPVKKLKIGQSIKKLKIGQSIQKLPVKIHFGAAYFSGVQEESQKLSKQLEITLSLIEESKQSKSDYISGAGLRSRPSDRSSNKTLEKDDPLGFEKLKEKLIEQLVQEVCDPRLSTIAIVGIGGCGKTSLAKMVYESIRVREHFDCQAWVDASHPLRYTDVLTDLLGQLNQQREEESAETDKRAKLRLLLQEQKFLIVLDDIWSHQELSHLQQTISKAGAQGSKVVITSRRSHIAYLPSQCIHDLSSGLSDSDASKLFCSKAFRRPESSVDFLEKVPEKFVKLCEGLPLAIKTLGTWLDRTAKNLDGWEKSYNNLTLELCSDDSDLSVLSRNLELSYNDLPSHLKSCFLYLSMFPEDHSISRERLLRLWVAEGFVIQERGFTEEQVAERYLNELIDRNLILVTAREGDRGRVRRCRVLRLVRQINISRHKSFATALDGNCNPCTGQKISRRVFLDNGPIKIIKGVRSFLVFGKENSPRELQTVFKTSKFLKVLDLNGAALTKFPKSIVGLYLLKYLSLRHTQIKILPKSIGNLQFLETLDLKHTMVGHLPPEICKLQMLRHLLVLRITGGVTISARNIRALSSLQKLSYIKVGSNRRILEALGELIGLRKLGLTGLKMENGEELCAYIQKLLNLSTLDLRSISDDEYLDLDHMCYPPLYLQHLYLRGPLGRVPQWISELTSLTKIGLESSKLKAQANPLEAIQALPNLAELNLVNYYTGDVLIFKAETFLKLVKLTIDQFEKLTLVVVQPGAMPVLKNLAIRRCQNLKELPAGIGGLSLLKEFLLYGMPDELIAKIRRNGEDRQLVKHIEVIHSYYEGPNKAITALYGAVTICEDLSPSKLHSESSDRRF